MKEGYILEIKGKKYFIDKAEVEGEIVVLVRTDDNQLFELSDIHQEGKTARATLTAFNTDGEEIETDTYPVSSGKKITEIQGRCAQRGVEVPRQVMIKAGRFAKQVLKEAEEDELADRKKARIQAPPPHVPTDEEKARGKEISNDKKSLYHLQKLDIGKYPGQVELLTIFLACVSRLLKDPVSLIVKGHPALGKSQVLKAILRELFPRQIWTRITIMTAKGIERVPDMLWHDKIIFFDEIHATREAEYQKRQAMSEKEVTRAGNFYDDKLKDWIYGEETTRQKACFLTTTIKDEIDPEDESRIHSIYFDTTKRFDKFVRGYMKRRRVRKSPTLELNAMKSIQLDLAEQPRDIYIPYMPFIENETGDRRDLARLGTYIGASALWHYPHRPRVILDDVEHIVAGVQDYYIAMCIYHTQGKISMEAKKILAAIPFIGKIVSNKDVTDLYHWTKEWANKFFEMVGASWVVKTEEENPPGSPVYRRNEIDGMTTPHEIARKLKAWLDNPGDDDPDDHAALVEQLGSPCVCYRKLIDGFYNPFTGQELDLDVEPVREG